MSTEKHTAFEELEIGINDVNSLPAEELLRATLKDLPAVRAARITLGGTVISYNPVGISPDQIRQAIERAGFTVDRMESGRRSPEHRGAEDTGKEIWRA